MLALLSVDLALMGKLASAKIWTHPLVFPPYVALTSAAIFTLHWIVISRRVQALRGRFTSARSVSQLRNYNRDHDDIDVSFTSRRETSIVNDFSEHVKQHGGPIIFGFQLARLIISAILLGLSLFSAMVDEERFMMDVVLKRRDHRLNDTGRISMIIAMTNIYLVYLAAFVVFSTPKWAKVATRHLNAIFFAFFAVYTYRDIYPLITIHGAPIDIGEGWILWVKMAALVLGALVIPLTIPRQYTPMDPEEPMPVPNPEQTASLASLATYTFLDPIVLLANKVPKLTLDLLPPMADFDRAKHLKARSFPHIDAFTNACKRYLFFGLMRVFRKEYMIMAVMLTLHVLSNFATPLGVKNLLHYVETNGTDSTIRPWFWILWLVLGPLIGSLTFQWYMVIMTRTHIHAEGIITQLVFEHALRIRVKAETSEGKDSVPETADSASVSTTQGQVSEDETARSQLATGSTVTLLPDSSESGHPQKPSSESDSSESSPASKPTPTSKTVANVGSSNAKNLTGKINNLVTTDLGNITDARDLLFPILYFPLQVTLCTVFLYNILGWSAFVGMAFMVSLFPIPGYITKKIQEVQIARLAKTDARVEVVSETMNVIRMVKLFGWEKMMDERIEKTREEELYYVRRRWMLDSLNGALNFAIPALTMIASYTTFTVLMKQELTASIVFSSMTVFDLLQKQISLVFWYISKIVTGKVSLDRLDDFLNNTELLDQFSGHTELSIVSPSLVAESDNIGFHQSSFTWSSRFNGSLTPSKREFVLRIENELFFPPGQFSIVVGPTGSGKTSLLMALLGEMHYIPLAPDSWFNLPRSGGIAYVAQESWVQNETIRDNILFGSPFDEERYNKVIYQCALTRDLAFFEAGDRTEVGEKGITLSGGQKARLTLARAIYSQTSILLLDDVLAALDVHTAKWIVEKCFAGDLVKGRTVVLVTHNITLMSSIADFVVSLGGDGKVQAHGSISDALKLNKDLDEEFKKDEELVEKASEEISPPEVGTSKPADGTLIVAEELEQGHVGWSAVKLYLTVMGGTRPHMFFLTYLGGFVLSQVMYAIQIWFLGYWATQYSIHPPSEVPIFRYLGVYSLFTGISIVAWTGALILLIAIGTVRAARALHERLIRSVLGTTLRWLDTTPISRIITRCTQDIRSMDGPFALNILYITELSISMVVKLATVVLLTPIFILPGVLVAILGGLCGQVYIKAQLPLKREMSNAKAPVLGHFGAAIAGLISLRAYGAQQAFIDRSLSRIDRYTKAGRTLYILNRWISIRMDALGGLFAAGLAAYLIYVQRTNASNTGFSLNMAVGFSSTFLYWVRVVNELETEGNSLERISKYIGIEQEPKSVQVGVPPAYWPADGSLHVENLSARYSADGPRVLHGISFDVKSGERVGIVGRTGSGKSSLTLALLRTIFTEGKVIYAGQNTSALNLDALRSSITIIPQMPELLSGTLRQNLDPFDQHDDALLNAALRSAGLFSLQEDTNEGRLTLDSSIASGGGNLSVGQRQIIALARAIVRGSKLLILDEATSAIDHKTDSIIQKSLRSELGTDVTVLTVAHRLQTVMDADKIMVLDAGRILEFDKPSELLKNPNSQLRALVEESGDKELLLSMAGTNGVSNAYYR